jgi:hypothetical protein
MIPIDQNKFPGQNNFIRPRRRAMIEKSIKETTSIILNNKNDEDEFFPSKTKEKNKQKDFNVSCELEEYYESSGEIMKDERKKSEIFNNSQVSDSSFNVYSNNNGICEDDIREEKIAEIEKIKLQNNKKEFEFVSMMVETSYASYRGYIKGLQDILFLQTIQELLENDLLVSRFEGNYMFLMTNDFWLDNLFQYEQNELFFIDNFETHGEKQLIKTTKTSDKWATQKVMKLKKKSKLPVEKQSSNNSKKFLNPSMKKLTKKASQLINIHSEELSLTNEQLYSSSSSLENEEEHQEDSLTKEKFVCIENFNNFYLLYLKLKHSFGIQRYFQTLIILLESILYKKERICYFGELFSEYSDQDNIPKPKNLTQFFKFEHDFQILCKNKFSKKIEHILKVIFNVCEVLPRVSFLTVS